MSIPSNHEVVLRNSVGLWFLLALCASLVVPQQGAAAQTSGTINVNVHLSQRGARISPTLYGAFFEEINHAGEGGLYGELVRNRAFNERTIDPKDPADCKTDLLDSAEPIGWSRVTTGDAKDSKGSIALDADQPLNTLPSSLKLQIDFASRGHGVGAANAGYWGIALDPDASYSGSLYAKNYRLSWRVDGQPRIHQQRRGSCPNFAHRPHNELAKVHIHAHRQRSI
jgi:hypothetical protein